MRIYPALLIAAASLSLPGIASAAQHHRPIGQETTIASAAGGGIRNWQAGPKGSDILYMQDRTLNFQVLINLFINPKTWYAIDFFQINATGETVPASRFP